MVKYLGKLGKMGLMVSTAVIICASGLFLMPCQTALAIDNPDSNPTVEDIWVWRNILETGDVLMIVFENTPYATTPTDYTYSEAFVWRWMNGTTELAQAEGYDYNEDGYGYNVIGFYLDASDAPAWAGTYTLTLSGKPSAFASPPQYSYNIPSSSYSALTDTDDVQASIADRIITIANDLRSRWGLTSTTTLIQETETATVLSLNGQTFFRGAIYGIQGMAPAAFPLTVASIFTDWATWSDNYTDNLTSQLAGTDIDAGFTAGETFFGTDYNLLGLLLACGMCLTVVIGNWALAGGNLWKGIIDAGGVGVIATRMSLVGLGELSLIAALCFIYISARIWKII